jgi:hypothetical protein
VSQRITFAPNIAAAFAVAIHVKLGTITSSPGPTPIASKDINSAELPLLVHKTCFIPKMLAAIVSTSWADDEVVNRRPSKAAFISFFSASPISVLHQLIGASELCPFE